MSRVKEAFSLIHAELVDLGSLMRELQVSIGKYHYDISGEVGKREEEHERLKERLGRAEGRIGQLEGTVRKYATSR